MTEELYGVAFDYNKNNFGSTEKQPCFLAHPFSLPEVLIETDGPIQKHGEIKWRQTSGQRLT
jgi:hypothetical protein